MKALDTLKHNILLKKVEISVPHPAIFGGGFSFLTSVVRRKTTVQLGSLGGAVSPSPWGSGAKPWKIFDICLLNSSKYFGTSA